MGCGFGGNNCLWIIVLILIICCCCGNDRNGLNAYGNSCCCD